MSTKSLCILLISLLAALPHSGLAQTSEAVEGRVYTLEQCKSMAVKAGADVKMSDYELQQAIETRRQAFTKYFPDVNAGFSAFWSNHDILQYTVLDMFTLGLIDKGRGAGVWAVQPIFAGGRIVNGNKLAKVGEDAARIRHEQSADNVAIDVEKLYWQLATFKATRKSVVSAIQLLDTLHTQVKVAVDAGLVLNNELIKVDLKRNNYRADLVDLENGIALVRMLLGQEMGLGIDANLDIEEVVPSVIPELPQSLFMDAASALPLTADHKLLEKNVEAKELERKMEIGNYLPEVGVAAGWFYHNIFKQNHNFAGLMVTVTVPISGWWGGSHAIKSKTIAVEEARTELNDLSQKLQIAMIDKWDDLTVAQRKMQLASESIIESKENLRITRANYDAGMNTIGDLLDAQTLHQKSISDYIAAYGKYKLSVSEYLKSSGRYSLAD